MIFCASTNQAKSYIMSILIMADKLPGENIYKVPPIGISPTGQSYKAVIVDDSATIRLFVKQILLSVSFDVTNEFDNGKTAALNIQNQGLKPQFMFIDVEMPVMNGIELVREIKPLLPECKIIMVTSSSDKAKVEELIKLGISGYIIKPFDRDALINKITSIM
jgi:two-component system, chemotaxis family, chemotaxis protein CheY